MMRYFGISLALSLVVSLNAAEHPKIFVFAAPERPADSFLEAAIPAALADSAGDVRRAIKDEIGGRYLTDRRADAAVLVQIMGREEVSGELRVHAHVTTRDGRATDVTGTSTHTWKQSGKVVGDRVTRWVKANEASLLSKP
jgi:hypothetical protein